MSTQFSAGNVAASIARPAPVGAFHFIRPSLMHGELLREIVNFLDAEDTSHPFQFPQWARSESGDFSTGTCFCTYKEHDRIKWFARCSTLHPLGRWALALKALVLTRGPVCRDESTSRSALEALVRYSNSEGFVFIEASPEVIPAKNPAAVDAFAQSGWRPLVGSRASLRLNLNRSEDEIIAGFRKATRYEVNRAARVGVVVEEAQSDVELSEFLRVYGEMSIRKGFHADRIQHVLQIIRWISNEPRRGVLLVAKHRNQILGGAVIVRSGSRCWYVWGATQKYETASAGHILQWNALLWAKKQGCTEYDFGGYTENAIAGPALFKKGFGGEVVHFMDCQRMIVNNKRDRILHFLSSLRG